MTIQMLGAGAFGAIIGWYLYFVNRYRTGDVQISDITTVLGTIGGAAVLTLFDSKSDLFGAYGIGLAVGFFCYFLSLLVLVSKSDNFTNDWFLDGRRRDPEPGWSIPAEARKTAAPMAVQPSGFHGTNPAAAPIVVRPVVLAPRAMDLTEVDGSRPLAAPQVDRVTAECLAQWPAHKEDCNQFVKAVAARLGVALSGNADAIVDSIRGAGWTPLADGVAAAAAAERGDFVVGGMKSSELGDAHGHVVVVVRGPLEHGKYPRAYWGSLSETIRDNGGLGKGVNWSFSRDKRDSISFGSRAVD